MTARPMFMRDSVRLKNLQEETRRERGRDYEPTKEMAAKQDEYRATLKARKDGTAPLYETSTGRRYE